MAALDDLCTTVVNTSGEERIFGFLPPFGRELAEDAEFTEIGTVLDWIRTRSGISPGSPKQIGAIQAALDNGDLTIKKTPAVVMYDATAEESQVLVLDDATLATADASWV